VIDVLIVAYHPDVTQLSALADALIDAKQKDDVPLSVRVCHNDGDAPTSGPVLDVYVRLRAAGIDTSVRGGEGNIGFGGAINKLVGDSAAPFVLALNQDAIPEPGALRELFNVASNDAPRQKRCPPYCKALSPSCWPRWGPPGKQRAAESASPSSSYTEFHYRSYYPFSIYYPRNFIT
jgi:GT2 family glycosyltransferase